jgi:hypothetical protein
MVNGKAPQKATLEMQASYIVSPFQGSYYAISYKGFTSLIPGYYLSPLCGWTEINLNFQFG